MSKKKAEKQDGFRITITGGVTVPLWVVLLVVFAPVVLAVLLQGPPEAIAALVNIIGLLMP